MVLILPSVGADAASLGKIEVTSHLGEAFNAEVPLELDADELVSKVFIEIADAGDYRIFEVYRDPILKSIRADIVSDQRGVRVQLSSRTTISTPFFNLVLKIRTGRVSYFRKYPVFLDAGKLTQSVSTRAPQPSVTAVQQIDNGATVSPATPSSGQVIATAQPAAAATAVPADNKNWARNAKYGPIVRGDSLSTVARRLRVDDRYSLNQTMVALFDKNKDSFDKQNMNLLKAGSVLKVPTAAEVEMHSRQEARSILSDHNRAWKSLTTEPHYAAVAEEQRTRYSPRVSVGKQADVVPTAAPAAVDGEAQDAAQVQAQLQAGESAQPAESQAVAEEASQSAASNAALTQTNALLTSIQEKNDQLQKQLGETNQSMKALQEKIDTLAVESSQARIEKLEILIARLQAQQEQERQLPAAQPMGAADWIVWLLAGLVLVLIAVVVVLLRREPVHPGAAANLNNQADNAAAAPEVAPSASDALAAAIENEVSEIEAEALSTSDSLATDNLPDALSDTDTAELEPFNAAQQPLDPEIDYVSEADVYIRYGMNEEALQQLDLALRLQPNNVQAHIKKAEILLGQNDKKAFDETIAVATMALAAVDLARFRNSVTQLGGDVDDLVPLSSDEERPAGEDVIVEEETGRQTLQIDDADIDDLDFELTDADDGDATRQFETRDNNAVAPASDPAAEELDWLFDDAFDHEDDASADADADTAQDFNKLSVDSQPQETAAPAARLLPEQEVNATQELDNLLQEFAEHDDAADIVPPVVAKPDTAAKEIPDEVDMGATMRLDQLFGEFQGEDDEPITFDDVHTTADKAPATAPANFADKATDDDAVGATMRLDQLLGEFDDDDDLISFDDNSELGASVFEATAPVSESSDSDIDHGATQELDSLLGAFADDHDDEDDDQALGFNKGSDELGASFFEAGEADSEFDETDIDIDHGATQALDSLLSEFADEEDDTPLASDTGAGMVSADSIDKARAEDEGDLTDEGATQVLGHLFDEFTDPDKNDKKR